MELTKNEIEIMDVLWKEARPLTRTEIVDLSPSDKTWKDSSIHILLNSLLRKSAIYEAGFVRAGKGFGRTFEPNISQEDFYADFLSDAAKKVNSTTFFSALFRDESITMDTLLELERMIEKKKEELK